MFAVNLNHVLPYLCPPVEKWRARHLGVKQVENQHFFRLIDGKTKANSRVSTRLNESADFGHSWKVNRLGLKVNTYFGNSRIIKSQKWNSAGCYSPQGQAQ